MSLPFIYKPRPGEEISVSRDADGRCAILVTSGTRTASARILAGEAPGFAVAAARAICEAAGKPEPVILERPEKPYTALIPGVTFTARHGGVDIAVKPAGTDSGHLGSPLTIRRFAASLAILAGEAEQEPDPAEVEELTRILRGIAPGMADPGGGDYKTAVVRPFAEAALRWMRDRQQRGGRP